MWYKCTIGRSNPGAACALRGLVVARIGGEPVTPFTWPELQATIQRAYDAMTPEELAAGRFWSRREIARLRLLGLLESKDDERQARTTDEVPR